MLRLAGEVALVTGSAQGIGKDIATLFAKEGAKIIINDIKQDAIDDAVEELKGQGYDAYGCKFDVTMRPEEIEALLAPVVEKTGNVSILVNNAGVSPKPNDGRKSPVEEMPYEEWNLVVDINFNGVFNCTKAVVEPMIAAQHGKIINMSSMSAQFYTEFTGIHYIATKAGVIGLTHALCGELAQYNINVNAIAPGRIWTPMARMVAPEVNQKVMAQIPMRRFGETIDIAKAALFLASSESKYINGTTLDVNGGWYMNF